jgi:hypothetical protein
VKSEAGSHRDVRQPLKWRVSGFADLAKCPAHSVAMSGIGICRWVLLELAIFTASFV